VQSRSSRAARFNQNMENNVSRRPESNRRCNAMQVTCINVLKYVEANSNMQGVITPLAWHIFWHPIRQISWCFLTLYLANYMLKFYLAYVLTFSLTHARWHSVWHMLCSDPMRPKGLASWRAERWCRGGWRRSWKGRKDKLTSKL
jgi:hypothetical protein